MVLAHVMKHKQIILPLLAALSVTACASVDPSAERESIFAGVAERTSVAPADPAEVDALLTEALTEERAVSLALAGNRALRARLADAGLARADWVEAGSLPGIAAELTVIPTEGSDILDIDIAAPVLRILALPAYRAEARARYDAARDGAVLAVIDFIAETQITWIEAVAARQRAELAGTVERAVNASLVTAEELHRAGNIPRVDLDRERVQAQRTRLDARNAELEAALAESALRARLGLDARSTLDLPGRLPDPAGLPPSPDALAARAREASLALDAARAEAEAAAIAARLANVDSLLGHVEAGGIFEREDGDWTEGYLIGAELPVFTLGHPERVRRRIMAEAALDRLAQLSTDIDAAARMLAHESETASEQARYIRETLLPTSQDALDGVMADYNAMQIGVFDLIGAFESHIQSGRSYVEALQRHHEARVRLEQLLAGGSAVAPMIEAAAPSGSAGGEGDH